MKQKIYKSKMDFKFEPLPERLMVDSAGYGTNDNFWLEVVVPVIYFLVICPIIFLATIYCLVTFL